jgi:hypothetical protein
VSTTGLVDTKPSPTKRRQYPETLKRQMVAETQAPGASVSIVARRHHVTRRANPPGMRRSGAASAEAVVSGVEFFPKRRRLAAVSECAKRGQPSPCRANGSNRPSPNIRGPPAYGLYLGIYYNLYGIADETTLTGTEVTGI